MANTKQKWQEIANRGLQDRFNPQTRAKFDEAVKRGLITMPTQQADVQNVDIASTPDGVGLPVNAIDAKTSQQDFIPTDEALAAPLPPTNQDDPSIGEEIVGGLDVAKTIISSAVAEPIAGLAGLISSPFVSQEQAVKNISAVRDFISLEPSTDEGKRNLKVVGDLVEKGVDLANIPASGLVGLSELLTGQGIEQAAESTERVQDEGLSQVLGDRILEETGSPELAAVAFSAPTAALEILGLKGLKSSTLKKASDLSSDAKKALKQSAPSINQIKSKATQLYRDLDKSGIKVKSEAFEKFVTDLNKTVDNAGIDRDLHKSSTAVMRRLGEEVGEAKSFSDLNKLRQIASDAAGDINPKDARIGNIILNKLDQGIDNLADLAGRDSKSARQLWRRAKVAESISGMVEGAGLAASGLENGLRIEARKILRSKKKRRGFTNSELKALKELDEGTTTANAAKFLGKFGLSEGKATSMLGAAVGGQIGTQLAGAPGAVAALSLGQISKAVSQKLTSNKAKFADQLVRAGGDGRAIVRAYLKNIPASKRSVSDLTELLLDPKITPESISKLNFKLKVVEDAKFFANEIKRKSKQAASVAAITQPELDKENK